MGLKAKLQLKELRLLKLLVTGFNKGLVISHFSQLPNFGIPLKKETNESFQKDLLLSLEVGCLFIVLLLVYCLEKGY